MRLSRGSRDRKLRVLLGARAMETRDQIARKKWAVRRGAQHEFNVRPISRGPVKGGKNARERSRKVFYRIGNDGKAEGGESSRIAVGVENEPVALRLQPRDHAAEVGAPGDLPTRFF